MRIKYKSRAIKTYRLLSLLMLSGMLAACGDNGQPQSIEDSPSGSNSVAVLDDLSSYVELTRGSINTDKYGNKFGDIPNQDSATFTFAGCEGETNLSVTGYDIDTNAEIEVVVNDVRIGHLSQSARNNARTIQIQALRLAGLIIFN